MPSRGDGPVIAPSCYRRAQDFTGARLSGVRFVSDYVQLQFDRGVTTFHVWPRIRLGGDAYEMPVAGYRDALRAFVGGRVGWRRRISG
jgi:hypothetical protein